MSASDDAAEVESDRIGDMNVWYGGCKFALKDYITDQQCRLLKYLVVVLYFSFCSISTFATPSSTLSIFCMPYSPHC